MPITFSISIKPVTEPIETRHRHKVNIGNVNLPWSILSRPSDINVR